MNYRQRNLIFKTIIFILSLIFAWYLIRNGILDNLVLKVLPIKFAAEFLAGMFYSSFLTAPISLAMIIVLSQNNNPITLAILAGLGAATADLLIVKFFRKKIAKEVNLVSHELHLQKASAFLKKLKMEFVIPLIGAMIIASPLPDELGLLMLGVSKLKYYEIAILTFVLNTAGILLIVIPINLLS